LDSPVDKRAAQMQFDEMPDELTGERGDQFMTDRPDFHHIVVLERPPKSAKTNVQTEPASHGPS
jgi:hypothetical protein